MLLPGTEYYAQVVAEDGKDDLNAAVERYVLSLGVTKDEIDAIRRIFIQD